MRRRDFIKLVGSAAGVWPFGAHAAGGRQRIGFLSITSAERDASNLAAFRDGLQHFGYAEGQTVDIGKLWESGNLRCKDPQRCRAGGPPD